MHDTVTVSDAELRRHTLIAGATGSGKTFAMLHLLIRQVSDCGCSLLLLDPKGELYDLMVSLLAQSDFDPESVVLLDPRAADGVPAWNPFLANLPTTQIANDIAALVERSTTSSGPRMRNLLTMALIVIASHRLSFFELARLLSSDHYRVGLLRQSVPSVDRIAYQEARHFMLEDFGRWTPSDRVQAAAVVLNKINEILRSAYLRPLLCARTNTLALEQLWQKPTVVLVRLDRTQLGDEGTRLLAGILSSSLFQTAFRSPGPVPVILGIDELPVFERFTGEAIAEIVTQARSQGLRLVVALQHLSQLSDKLRDTLIANAAVRLFFRAGDEDARTLGASLAAGSQPAIECLEVAAASRNHGELVWRSHRILDAHGKPLRVSLGAWPSVQAKLEGAPDPIGLLSEWGRQSGVSRFYVRAPHSGQAFELRSYVGNLGLNYYAIQGPGLRLGVAFPRPKLTVLERTNEAAEARRWASRLKDLPVQHAVLRRAGLPTSIIRIANIQSLGTEPGRIDGFKFQSTARFAQSPKEIETARRWREDRLEEIGTGRWLAVTNGEVDDGSID